MTPQELKKSILQLAAQGQLAPQNPNDEPACKLLERIAEVQKRLIKERKIKKFKSTSRIFRRDGRFYESINGGEPACIDKEIPFEIPDSWEWCRLKSICSIATGKKDANYGSPDGEFPFFTCAKEPIKCKSYSFDGESLLLAGNGDIGNISYYSGKFEAYQRTYVLQSYVSGYLQYVHILLLYNWVEYNNEKMFGSAIPYIRLGNIEEYLVPLPPLAEQKRIVAKIEELLPYIDCYGQAWSRLDALNKRFPDEIQKSLLQLAVQGKLVEQRPEEGTAAELYQQIRAKKQQLIEAGKLKKEKPLPEITEEEKPFDIPENWMWVRMRSITSVLYGYPFESNLFSENTDGMPLIRIRDVIPGKTKTFTTEIVSDEYIVKNGDMLVGMDGNFNVNYWNGGTAYLNQRVCRICADKTVLLQEYLFYYLPLVLKKISNSVSYLTVKHLSDKHISAMIIPLPPLAEQRRIVAKIEELLGACEKLKRAILR